MKSRKRKIKMLFFILIAVFLFSTWSIRFTQSYFSNAGFAEQKTMGSNTGFEVTRYYLNE